MESRPREIPAHRILVVDDERIIADTLAIILRKNGFETAVAYDGLTAIEKARTWHPDLLLSDVAMPETDGIETASQILRLVPRCRVLLIAGQAGIVAKVTEAIEASRHPFQILAKPVHPTELLSHIREILAAGSAETADGSDRESSFS